MKPEYRRAFDTVMTSETGKLIRRYCQEVADSIADLRNEDYKDMPSEARILASQAIQRLIVDEMYIHSKKDNAKVDNYA
jgi:primosomal protein N''